MNGKPDRFVGTKFEDLKICRVFKVFRITCMGFTDHFSLKCLTIIKNALFTIPVFLRHMLFEKLKHFVQIWDDELFPFRPNQLVDV